MPSSAKSIAPSLEKSLKVKGLCRPVFVFILKRIKEKPPRYCSTHLFFNLKTDNLFYKINKLNF
jgi:hypothetical protein